MVLFFKGCVRYIFASLFFKSKREHFWNWKMFFISLRRLFPFSRKSNFRISGIQLSWRHQMRKHKRRNTLLNNLGNKHSLLMKFGQFKSYYKGKNFIKNFYKTSNQKTSLRPFCVCENLSTTTCGKCNSKTIKICPNQHTDFLRFLCLKLVSRSHFS